MPDYRTKENTITIGSCHVYLVEWDGGAIPDHDELCVEANRFCYVKGGATVSYTTTSKEIKDDLGLIKKTYISEDAATVKLGLLGWNGETFQKMLATARSTEAAGIRKTKVGGIANDDGKLYVLCLHHHDGQDGDCWWTIAGKNTEGLELSYDTEEGVPVNPSFSAYPMDNEGTLIIYEEQIGTSQGCKLVSFAVAGASASIDQTNKTAKVTVPSGTAVTALAAAFELSPNATAKVGSTTQVSGVTTNNYTNPVGFVVAAADGSHSATYTVTVTVASAG